MKSSLYTFRCWFIVFSFSAEKIYTKNVNFEFKTAHQTIIILADERGDFLGKIPATEKNIAIKFLMFSGQNPNHPHLLVFFFPTDKKKMQVAFVKRTIRRSYICTRMYVYFTVSAKRRHKNSRANRIVCPILSSRMR